MLNIRQGTFETNSSSTHSLVIFHEDWDRNGYEYTFNFPMDIIGGYYGRGCSRVLSTPQAKLNYIWTAIVDLYCEYDDEKKEIRHTDNSLYWMKILQEVAPKSNFILPKYGDYNKGVDHCGNLVDFFNECRLNNEILKDLILEDNSFILVEGDEFCMVISAFYPDYWTNEEKLVELRDNYKIYVKGN